ncbi:short chain dehydrogenase/reductase family protein [Xylariaceae sp. FL1651]|nr:short chain dehydrogenase/reductase family protein [Xylariaceae sp. FL1651]
MTASKVVLVTGANQGLGFAVLKVAGSRQSEYTYILASRDLKRGKEAAAALREAGVKAIVDVIQLDVTKNDEISAAAAYVDEKYGRLDVLINNAGIIRYPPPGDLATLRSMYNEILNTNITSVALVTEAFTPLLYESKDPKVINVSSGLGSCANSLTKKMGRAPPYGASKIGMNGLTVHLQVAENDRIEVEGESVDKPRIRYYACAPGPLRTAFSNFNPICRPPERGAEVIVHLLADDSHLYEGGSYWEYEEGEMRRVPW